MSSPFKRKSRKSRSKSPEDVRPRTTTAYTNLDSSEPSADESSSSSKPDKSCGFPKALLKFIHPKTDKKYSPLKDEDDSKPKKERSQSAPLNSKSANKSKPDRGYSAPSAGASEHPILGIPAVDVEYVRTRTDYPDRMIVKWYNLIQEHRNNYNKVCVTYEQFHNLAKYVYEEKDRILTSAVFDLYSDCFSFVKFRKFMKALYSVSQQTNDHELKLDLLQYMCRDIEDSKSRVNKDKLLSVLSKAGDLDTKQREKVGEDIEWIFDSLKEYMTKPGVLHSAHFRYGLEKSYLRISQDLMQSKYHVSTCVPDLTAAILAISNFTWLKEKPLSLSTLQLHYLKSDDVEDKKKEELEKPACGAAVGQSDVLGASASASERLFGTDNESTTSSTADLL